jgi:phosphorylase kinase alpha/beta subunit
MNESTTERLNAYYATVNGIILSRQNPATGLIPASVAVTSHGDYRDAWVRDNVYSIMAVWGLALAYRRLDDNLGRAYELEHATVKNMRGLLFSMIQQADKVELFKNTQVRLYASMLMNSASITRCMQNTTQQQAQQS